ncbi:hypothetical protein BpHYR1_035705 [Brachionus plicatilis]|uniref:Uncharacterized protein n=1 Tax=Brachionus plicatilis TaxID=10195 RepID=A0A3M7Q288_BRAPC|nr:hypothetical protein BpHYR1_035705 [Brachionus plicatilis]
MDKMKNIKCIYRSKPHRQKTVVNNENYRLYEIEFERMDIKQFTICLTILTLYFNNDYYN